MPQPVKISDELLLDARQTATAMERSIAGQIEYWANLGRAIDPILQGKQATKLAASSKSLAERIRIAGTSKGREKVFAYLKTRPFPHYEAAPGQKGLLVRIEENGKRTTGRFVNRKFQAVGAGGK